jgi:hypothetical protein
VIRELYRAERAINAKRDFRLGPSPIHGTGVFSNRAYEPNEVVGRAISSLVDEGRGGIRRTLLGIYVNHREVPNTRLEKSQDSDRYFLRAIRAIEPDAEITMSYWDTPPFIAKPHQIDPVGFTTWK